MSPSELMTIALQAYQSGKLVEAEWQCQQVLEHQPQHVPALHLLAAVAYQTHRPDSAIAYYQRVIALEPAHAEAHSNLAVVLQERGEWQSATEHFQRSLRLNPDHASAHFNFGNLLLQQSDWTGAIAHYQQAIRLRPNYAKAYNNLGNALREQGQIEAAIAAYQQAIGLQPTDAQAYSNLGNALQALGDLDAAVAQYHTALALQPDYPGLYFNLGNALRGLYQFEAASDYYQQALALNPNQAEFHNNLALVLQEQNQLEAALSHFQQAVRLQPNNVEAHSNLGVVLYELSDLPGAIAHCERAIALNPQFAEAHINLSFALLLSGDLKRGFAEYEWRWQYEAFKALSVDKPRWDGSDLQGRTILLYAELGLGDVIHFIRYLPWVVQRGGRVIVDCRPELMRLLSTVDGIDQLVPRGSERPSFDVYSPLLSLPHLLNDTLETIPNQVPYLQAIDSFELPDRQPNKLAIGITWASGIPPDDGHLESYLRYLRAYRNRTAPLSILMELQTVPGVQLYSLQVGAHAADIAEGGVENLCNLAPYIQDFADTAAIVAQLDLVISVDTAIVHLAGAMGKPVWVVLPFAPDWRWLLNRDDSPWYPTMRLFRQDKPGDWQGAIAKVIAALRAL